MFTKAIAKALVIVLTVGMTSLVATPSEATVNADSLTVSSTNITQYLGETETSSSPEVTLTYIASNPGDTVSVLAPIVSMPAGSTTFPILKLTQVTNGNVDTSTVLDGPVQLNYEFKTSVPTAYVSAAGNTVAVTAKFKLYLDAPTRAGTYRVGVVAQLTGGGGILNSVLQNVYFTVVDPVITNADSIISNPGDITNKSDAIISASKSADTANEIAVIRTTMKNSSGISVTRDSYTAVITGPGTLGSAALSSNINTSSSGRVIQVRAGDAVTVYADGTSGQATITILTLGGTEVGRKTINFVDLSNLSSAVLALSFSSFPEKGSLVTLTGLVNLPGTVRFTNNGKTLGSCARVVASGSPRTAVCQWKPPTSGSVSIVARFTPTDQGISAVTTTKVLAIGRRSGRR